ncbi:pilus assembly protein PilX [Motiliproteus coralliicola]|uniref:Pilus assembly protein PilX n=2 Tax=Motiliproteus coralliicola TaxID=2283196 RepID=A0A369WB71_9GAMM|nr:pilus assembly protein PilX [Motiliproteus coralliicola]
MTLIVCLIILVVLTLVGVGSIRDTTLEEKMAGNLRDRNMAFQAAESALRVGEDFIETTVVLPEFNGTDGLYAQLNDVINGVSWSVSSAVRSYDDYSPELTGTNSAPVYIIEQMESEAESASMEAGTEQNTEQFYRITARAVGGTDTAVVILQSIYRR